MTYFSNSDWTLRFCIYSVLFVLRCLWFTLPSFSPSNSSATKQATETSVLEKYVEYSPFVVGVILSSLNFIQIPFWTSWNLYLLNGNYIEISKSRKYFYVVGTLIGTFSGMLVLILLLNFVTNETDFLAKYLMKVIIPVVFIGLGLYQAFSFYRKYKK